MKRYLARIAGIPDRIRLQAAVLILLFVLAPAGSLHAAANGYRRSVEAYTLPDVTLIDQNGRRVRLRQLADDTKPLIVDFIFGTCTTICPVLSAGYTGLQQKLGSDTQRVRLISISIDPENDSPKVMKEYLRRFRAKPGWDFLSGSRTDIDRVMKSLDAYIPDKMSHYPLTLIKSGRESSWIRLNGIMSSAEFWSECQKVGIR